MTKLPPSRLRKQTAEPDRRTFIQGAGMSLVLGVLGNALGSVGRSALWGIEEAHAQTTPFSRNWLVEKARVMAAKPFSTRRVTVDKRWSKLTYDQYRQIRVPSSARMWRTEGLPFQMDLLPAGFLFKEPVNINIVADGKSTAVKSTPDSFTYPPGVTVEDGKALPYSGLRLAYPINTPSVMDEVIVFQGASYFRAVARDQNYGLSARGLAIKTGDPEGEEFPVFTDFWVERPQADDTTVVVHALLDSVSATGAYRFTVRPGDDTVVDVELTLFARKKMDRIGLAPLTSMFLFDGTNRNRFLDFRDAVHDSNGLQVLNGRGEWLWRPLANPEQLQISAFVDDSPHGFGLIQRAQKFVDFQDLEARYERRPSVWVEPIGDWGKGAVQLVEIPSHRETDDNIIAFWRPKEPIQAGTSFSTSYRLHWNKGPAMPANLASVTHTRVGLSFDQKRLLFVTDWTDCKQDIAGLSVDLSASAGEVKHAVLQPNPETGGMRVSFEFSPGEATLSEFRMQLTAGGRPASEIWLYRWTGHM